MIQSVLEANADAVNSVYTTNDVYALVSTAPHVCIAYQRRSWVALIQPSDSACFGDSVRTAATPSAEAVAIRHHVGPVGYIHQQVTYR